jgi:hypothetical protein
MAGMINFRLRPIVPAKARGRLKACKSEPPVSQMKEEADYEGENEDEDDCLRPA